MSLSSLSATARTTPTAWDYEPLARHYESRAPYHPSALAAILEEARFLPLGEAVDVGAGTGRFSGELARAGFAVWAVEPSAAMRAIGEERCRGLQICWRDARGEATGLPDARHRLVSFASTFNVMPDPDRALAEAARLLVPGGLLVCLWNHRDLDDPLQRAIENRVRARLPAFAYGSRRDDPSARIARSPLFEAPRSLALAHVHRTAVATFLDGFRAHATLVRQAGGRLESVLADIGALLADVSEIAVPFTTRIWFARRGVYVR